MNNLDEIYRLMEKRDFIHAESLALNLYEKGKCKSDIAEILLAISIERNDISLAVKRCSMVANLPITSYRLFLQARVYFMSGQRKAAMEMLNLGLDDIYKKRAHSDVLEKIYNLLGQCYRFYGYPDKAAKCYWCAYKNATDIRLKRLEYSNYLFNLHYLDIPSCDYIAAHKRYNDLFNGIEQYKHYGIKKKKKLRIGYISPDFRNHVVLRFTYTLLTAYDRNKFDVYCYSTGREDDYSKFVAENVDVWHSLQGYLSEKIAECIYNDKIDILVELSGHCSGGNLPVLAYKPAPIQICAIGYFATTGLKTVDYFITDSKLSPDADSFIEQLICLPNSHFCYTPIYDAPLFKYPPCLSSKYITFGSFNNLTKVTDEVLQVWYRILLEIPNSVLLLKGELFNDEYGCEIFRKRLTKIGISLSRVELRGITKDYLYEYLEMDIALDTFPYPGGGTTCDALYMGVPVITLMDGTHGGNFGASILKNIGLDATCANSKEEYIQIAVDLAKDVELLKILHMNLRKMMLESPVMNVQLYMQDLEKEYIKIWQKYCDTQDNGKYYRMSKSAEQRGKYNNVINCCVKALHDASLCHDEVAEIYNRMARAYCNLAMPDEAVDKYLKASNIADDIEIKRIAYSNYLYTLHMLYKDSLFMNKAAREYRNLLTGIKSFKHENRRIKSKIRVGYLSSDLYYHVVSEFVNALFCKYDNRNFEVYVYSNNEQDNLSIELSKYVDKWNCVKDFNHHEIAKIIYNDEIDILVELGGHTAKNNLPVLAYRPAPVQICGIGYFGSTGMDTVDYILGDINLDMQDDMDEFTEKIIRLSSSHWCYQPLLEIENKNVIVGVQYYGDPCNTPEAPFQKNGYITFGSFNDFKKINITVLKAWATILKSVPDSKLYLKGKAYTNNDIKNRFLEMCNIAGLDMTRIILEAPSADYMQCYKNVDIALDTFPYVGGGTTCDALYMGVPVVTLYGKTHHSRFGYSALMNVNLPECSATDVDEYIYKSIALAEDRKKLKYLHKVIRRRMQISSLMDSGKYMAELEEAYQEIWYKYSKIKLSNKTDLAKGLTYIYYKDYSRAELYLKKSLRAEKHQLVEVYELLASLEKERKNDLSALKYIQKAFQQLETEVYKGSSEFQHELLNNYGDALKRLGNIEEAIGKYRQAFYVSDKLEHKVSSYSNYLYTLICSMADSSYVYDEHKKFNKVFSDVRRIVDDKHNIYINNKKKIRLAYMSPDFRQHVMFSFYYSLLNEYDKDKFYVTCYQLTNREDGYTQHLKKKVDSWIKITDSSLWAIANKIKYDNQDIVVDLSGHTAYSGLGVFVYRVAPVQISGLGWMETTGLYETDYFITDKFVDPPKDNYLMERPLYLTTQLCYTARNDVPSIIVVPYIKNGYVTFGVFNQWYKINDFILGLWKRIMDGVPNSRIIIKNQLMIGLEAQENAFKRMYALGFDMDRVIFEPATNNYMNRYLSIDIALDTYPYPGGGTTCDALYMGVPVVTLYGKRRGSRFGYSILKNMNLDILIANSPDKYVSIAVSLALNVDLLFELHYNLRTILKSSPVMNSRRYVREIEAAYLQVLGEEK